MAKWIPGLKCIVIDNSSTTRDIEKLYRLCRCSSPCVAVVTYDHVRRRCSELSFPSWSVVFLDEGHRIRNPDAEVTVSCKKLQCSRRFILSGSPIQNSLTELWSLMDFVYPGDSRFVDIPRISPVLTLDLQVNSALYQFSKISSSRPFVWAAFQTQPRDSFTSPTLAQSRSETLFASTCCGE